MEKQMAFGYKCLNINTDYGAKDPGKLLVKESVGAKFLNYIKEHPKCDPKKAVKAVTGKTNHWSMTWAFKLNKLYTDKVTYSKKKITITKDDKKFKTTVRTAKHEVVLTKKGEKYLDKALNRTEKPLKSKKIADTKKISKKTIKKSSKSKVVTK